MSDQQRQVECTIPVLRVANLARSVRFYTETLGFKLDWGAGEGSNVCSVSRDGCCTMLSEGARGNPEAWVWVGLENNSLFTLFRSRGVKVIQEPKNYPWAFEMKFADLDGNVLWLGTEPKKDQPFESEA